MAHSTKVHQVQLHVCTQQRYAPNPNCCANKGSNALIEGLRQEALNNNMDVEIVATKCLLRCDDGPNIKLIPSNKIWSHVSAESIPRIIQECKKTSINY